MTGQTVESVTVQGRDVVLTQKQYGVPLRGRPKSHTRKPRTFVQERDNLWPFVGLYPDGFRPSHAAPKGYETMRSYFAHCYVNTDLEAIRLATMTEF